MVSMSTWKRPLAAREGRKGAARLLVFICVIYCVTWLLAAPGMGAPSRCIISEDKDEGPKVAFNFHSRREYRRVPLANAEHGNQPRPKYSII